MHVEFTELTKVLTMPTTDHACRKLHVDNLVVTCGDARFREFFARWINVQLDGLADRHTWPGCTRGLTGQDTRDATVEVIRTYCRLHGITTVHWFAHQDCGGHGGADEHANVADELQYHHQDLLRTVSIINTEFPNMEIRIYFVGCIDLYIRDWPRQFRWTELPLEAP